MSSPPGQTSFGGLLKKHQIMGALHNETTDSQEREIITYLLGGGKLTADSAWHLFGSRRLASRINTIQHKIEIGRHKIPTINRKGKNVLVSEYWAVLEQPQTQVAQSQ
jgi:Helix-turn-helix domain